MPNAEEIELVSIAQGNFLVFYRSRLLGRIDSVVVGSGKGEFKFDIFPWYLLQGNCAVDIDVNGRQFAAMQRMFDVNNAKVWLYDEAQRKGRLF